LRQARRGLLLGLVLAIVPVASAQAAPFTIDARGSNTGLGRVLAIGGFKPDRDPTLEGAIAAYGAPSRQRSLSNGSACRVVWSGIGVRILFANFGGGSACDPALGRVATARAYGSRWRTKRGLQVGQRVRRLRRLYPAAVRRGRGYRLVKGVSIYGTGGSYGVLSARVRNDRVRSFGLQIFAAGD
jgi:hypothetical protein